jgi:hypothetical protein
MVFGRRVPVSSKGCIRSRSAVFQSLGGSPANICATISAQSLADVRRVLANKGRSARMAGHSRTGSLAGVSAP